MKLIIRPTDQASADELGGKAAALRQLAERFQVPAWFVLTRDAFQSCLNPEQRAKLQSAKAMEEIALVMDSLRPHPALSSELNKSIERTCKDSTHFAVRVSMSREEAKECMPSGALEARLFVPQERIIEYALDLWRLFYGDVCLRYRRERRQPALVLPPPILIQSMIDPDCSGTACDVDTSSGRRDIAVVKAVPGLGSALSNGDSEPDTFFVEMDGEIAKAVVGNKIAAHRADSSAGRGIKLVSLQQIERNRACLSDEQAAAIANLARKAARLCNRPQKVEWCVKEGRLYALGASRVSELARLPDPAGARAHWRCEPDLSGPTSPLSFSLHRALSSAGWRDLAALCRSIPPDGIADPAGRLLGYVNGEVFFSFSAWEELVSSLSLPPAIKAKLSMAGESEPPRLRRREAQAEDDLRAGAGKAIAGAQALAASLAAVRALDRELTSLAAALGACRDSLDQIEVQRPEELSAAADRMRAILFGKARIGALSQATLMILENSMRELLPSKKAEIAKALARVWGAALHEQLNLLLAGAQAANAISGGAETFNSGSPEEIRKLIGRDEKLKEIVDDYFARFGEMGLEPLKLECAGLGQNPIPLFRAIGRLAHGLADGSISDEREDDGPDLGSLGAGLAATQALRFRALLRLYKRQLGIAARWKRVVAGAFDDLRRIANELACRLYAVDMIASAEDGQFLSFEEMADLINGQALSPNLRGLIASRKQAASQRDRPGHTFETRGIVYQGNTFQPAGARWNKSATDGTPAGGGTAKGPLVIMRSLDQPFEPGSILFLDEAKNGLIYLLPFCSGLIIGNPDPGRPALLLAARLGLPVVIGLRDIEQELGSGDWVEIDGANGQIRPIESAKKPRASSAPAEERATPVSSS